jgi:hypothetical protein
VLDPLSHPYKTAGKITIIYTLIFIFLNSKIQDKRFSAYNSKHFLTSFLREWNFDLLGLSLNTRIWPVPLFQKIHYVSLCWDFVLHSYLE